MARCRCIGPPSTATPRCCADVLRYSPPLDAADRDFNGTAMGWVIQGAARLARHLHRPARANARRLLLEAGAEVDEAALPTGNDALDTVLRDWFVKRK